MWQLKTIINIYNKKNMKKSINEKEQCVQTDVSGSFHPVLLKYKKWRDENDEDYCYDEVHEFLADLSRSEMMSFMDWCIKNCH